MSISIKLIAFGVGRRQSMDLQEEDPALERHPPGFCFFVFLLHSEFLGELQAGVQGEGCGLQGTAPFGWFSLE